MLIKEIHDTLNLLYTEKNNLLSDLSNKDYIGVKIAMGVATKEDYADDILKTEMWRARLRVVLKEIENLEKELEALATDKEEI